MKKHFNKEIAMTIEDDKDFENYFKCCNCYDVYTDGDFNVRDQCHITWKNWGSPNRDCNIKVN